MREFRDASRRLSFDLADDGPMFPVYASRLEKICNARRIKQLNGLDQRWWDYDVDGTTVVLHSDAMAGISLHVEDGTRDDLLRRIVAQITEDAPPNGGPATQLGSSDVTEGPPSVS
jgi:hypothetical protein